MRVFQGWLVLSGRQRERGEGRIGDMVMKKAGMGELCCGKKQDSMGTPRRTWT